jgi:hypothetical protein
MRRRRRWGARDGVVNFLLKRLRSPTWSLKPIPLVIKLSGTARLVPRSRGRAAAGLLGPFGVFLIERGRLGTHYTCDFSRLVLPFGSFGKESG